MRRFLCGLLILSTALFAGCARQPEAASERFPVCFDERIYYGMTQEEITDLLGEPAGGWDDDETIASHVVVYDWVYENAESTVDFCFMDGGSDWILYNVELRVYCGETACETVLSRLKEQVEQTYGGHPDFSWTLVSSDVTDGWMFSIDLMDAGVAGYAMGSIDMVTYSCIGCNEGEIA